MKNRLTGRPWLPWGRLGPLLRSTSHAARSGLRRGLGAVGVFGVLAATFAPNLALAAGARACWEAFFRDAGISTPPGEIAAFRYAERTFHVPVGYLWRGTPRPQLGTQDAVWLLAWLPHLAPGTPEQLREFRRNPAAPYVRITIFGHGTMMSATELAERILVWERVDPRTSERDDFGYDVYRPQNGMAWRSEIHIAPDRSTLFYCGRPTDVFRNPLCTARRDFGGGMRAEMTFKKADMAVYADLDRRLLAMLRCMLPETAHSAPDPGRGG